VLRFGSEGVGSAVVGSLSVCGAVADEVLQVGDVVVVFGVMLDPDLEGVEDPRVAGGDGGVGEVIDAALDRFDELGRSASECPQVEFAVVVPDAARDFGLSFGEPVEVMVDELLLVGGGVDAFGGERSNLAGDGVKLLVELGNVKLGIGAGDLSVELVEGTGFGGVVAGGAELFEEVLQPG
jgi:hypothetical protein